MFYLFVIKGCDVAERERVRGCDTPGQADGTQVTTPVFGRPQQRQQLATAVAATATTGTINCNNFVFKLL